MMRRATDPADLAEVRTFTTRETWLLRILAGALVLVLVLVAALAGITLRVSSRADKVVAALENDRQEREDLRRLADALALLASATTAEDRDAARAALQQLQRDLNQRGDTTVPGSTTSTTRRAAGAAGRTTTTRGPPPAPTSSTTTTSPPPTTTRPDPPPTTTTTARPCLLEVPAAGRLCP